VRSPISKSKPYQDSPTNEVLSVSVRVETDAVPVISLSDSEDDSDLVHTASRSLMFEKEPEKPGPIETPILPRLEDEDKELAECIARAREGTRRKKFSPLLQTSLLHDGVASSLSGGFGSPVSGPDPVISIFISSRIEGAKPCLFKRKLSQRLKDIRVGWCDIQFIGGQPMPESVKSEIFLTWRMKRVFDVTTCKAMGVKVNSRGMLCSDGDDIDPEGRIHLEAWTEELFEQHKEQKAAERKRLVRDPLEDEEPEVIKAPVAPKVKIILKSKDAELKLQVGPTTPISKLIATFRANKQIPHDKFISLFLDGDELDPGILVADTDLEDMVTIDVHIN
jgi:Ubiquitin-2 like Rad60 SUMO-like